MRKSTALLAGMALSALVMIGLTVSAEQSSASFTATTTNPGNSFATATLTMSNNHDTAATSLISLANMVPGDTASRSVTITNSGNVGFTYTTAISATANTVLWSDTTNGLQVTVKRGTTVLYGPAALSGLTIGASPTIAAAGTDTLTFDFALPVGAGDSFQNKTQDFTITYSASQLAGANRP